MTAQTLASEARAKYEASLKTLKSFIADFPNVAQRIEEHDGRLAALELKFAELRRETSSVLSEANRISITTGIGRRTSSTDKVLELKRPSIDNDFDTKFVSIGDVLEPRRSSKDHIGDVLEPRRNSKDQFPERKRSSLDKSAKVVSVVDVVEEVEIESVEIQENHMSRRTSSTSSVSTTTSEKMPVSAPNVRTSTVSFADKEIVHRYSFHEHEAIFPVHGHWLPSEITNKRKSFEEARDFAKAVGGRMIHVETGIEGIETLECVLVEPMGKILSPQEYVSTGLVFCLDGAEHEAALLEEWGEVLKATKWLDAGISFVLPDVSSLADVEDLEIAVEAVLRHVKCETCMFTGKAWGAQLAAEMAGRSRLCEKIDGVLLVAPSSPAPNECCNIEVPVMLIWAQNDEVSPFQEIREWYENLEQRRAATFVKDLNTGGHFIPDLLKQGETASQVLFFTVCSFLMVQLVQAAERVSGSEPYRLAENTARLCDELPPFLASQIGGDPESGVASALSGDASKVRRRMNNLAKVLRDWIREGMQEMASATE